MKKRVLQSLVTLFVVALFVSGCGGSDDFVGGVNGATGTASNADTGTIIFRAELAAPGTVVTDPSVVPFNVTHFRFTGRNVAGGRVYGPKTVVKQPVVTLNEVPTSVGKLFVELLDDTTLVGLGTAEVSISPGGVVQVTNINFFGIDGGAVGTPGGSSGGSSTGGISGTGGSGTSTATAGGSGTATASTGGSGTATATTGGSGTATGGTTSATTGGSGTNTTSGSGTSGTGGSGSVTTSGGSGGGSTGGGGQTDVFASASNNFQSALNVGVGIGGATLIPLPDNQNLSGVSVNGNDTVFTVSQAGTYNISYNVSLATASVLAETNLDINGADYGPSQRTTVINVGDTSFNGLVTLNAGSTVSLEISGVVVGLNLGSGSAANISVVRISN